MPKKAPKKEKYEASIKIAGKVSTNSGDTVSKAIDGLKVGNVRSIAVLTVKHGDKVKEKILYPHVATKLFNTQGLIRELNLKNISNLFDGI